MKVHAFLDQDHMCNVDIANKELKGLTTEVDIPEELAERWWRIRDEQEQTEIELAQALIAAGYQPAAESDALQAYLEDVA